jgi:hypothetical protein
MALRFYNKHKAKPNFWDKLFQFLFGACILLWVTATIIFVGGDQIIAQNTFYLGLLSLFLSFTSLFISWKKQ